jgi:hypothetical protein
LQKESSSLEGEEDVKAFGFLVDSRDILLLQPRSSESALLEPDFYLISVRIAYECVWQAGTKLPLRADGPFGASDKMCGKHPIWHIVPGKADGLQPVTYESR